MYYMQLNKPNEWYATARMFLIDCKTLKVTGSRESNTKELLFIHASELISNASGAASIMIFGKFAKVSINISGRQVLD